MSVPRFTARLTMLMALPAILAAQPASFSFDDAQQFLKTHCQACHQGSAPESARTTSEPSQEGVAVVAEPAVPPPIAE
jgi:mono/diheme cytochrome c family protein